MSSISSNEGKIGKIFPHLIINSLRRAHESSVGIHTSASNESGSLHTQRLRPRGSSSGEGILLSLLALT